MPIYIELHRHTNLYIKLLCLKIGSLSLFVQLKAGLVANIGLRLTAWQQGYTQKRQSSFFFTSSWQSKLYIVYPRSYPISSVYNLKSGGRKGPRSFYYFIIVPPLLLPMTSLLVCIYKFPCTRNLIIIIIKIIMIYVYIYKVTYSFTHRYMFYPLLGSSPFYWYKVFKSWSDDRTGEKL